jgi:hypothetical protein
MIITAYELDRWLDSRDEYRSEPPEPDVDASPCGGRCTPEGCLSARCCVDAPGEEG